MSGLNEAVEQDDIVSETGKVCRRPEKTGSQVRRSKSFTELLIKGKSKS